MERVDYYLYKDVRIIKTDGQIVEGPCVSFESAIESRLKTATMDIEQEFHREVVPLVDIASIEVISE